MGKSKGPSSKRRKPVPPDKQVASRQEEWEMQSQAFHALLVHQWPALEGLLDVDDLKVLWDAKFRNVASIEAATEATLLGLPLAPGIVSVLKSAKGLGDDFSNRSGNSSAEPNEDLRQFWEALKSAEIEDIEDTLEDGSKQTIQILTLPESAFPGESEESERRLLVRQCYVDLADMMLAHFQNKGRVFVLNGNPGIGKSLFSFYFMWRLAKLGGQTIVWERKNADDDRVLMSDGGSFGGSMEDFKTELQNRDTWYLVDGKPPKHPNAKTILVCSPDHENIKEAVKWGNGDWRWMPVWSWDEIRAAGIHIFGQPEAEFRERYEKWLGIPRYVLQLLGEAYQSSLDRAIDQCSLDILAQSFTSLTAHKQISHKLVHVQVKEGYLEGATEIVEGYTYFRLAGKYMTYKDSEVEAFLANAAGNTDIQSFLGKILEKKKAHKILQGGGKFMFRDLSVDAAEQPAYEQQFPKCSEIKIIDNHDDIRHLKDGVYGWPGSMNWHFAGVDAVVQPNLLYQITVSQNHGINSHALVTAAKYLRCGAANAKLVFAVPPAAFSHDHGLQYAKAIWGKPELTKLARSIPQFVMQIPIKRYERSDTAPANEAMGLIEDENMME